MLRDFCPLRWGCERFNAVAEDAPGATRSFPESSRPDASVEARPGSVRREFLPCARPLVAERTERSCPFPSSVEVPSAADSAVDPCSCVLRGLLRRPACCLDEPRAPRPPLDGVAIGVVLIEASGD